MFGGMTDSHIPRDQLPSWVAAAIPPDERIVRLLTDTEARSHAQWRDLEPGAQVVVVDKKNIRFQRVVTPPKDTVIRARVPSDLADRLHRAGAANGGASAVLRTLIERGLEDFEASDALKVPDDGRREKFVRGRLERKAKREAAKRK